jgi:uncharacterized phage protein (TIGR01671 family)
VSREIKFRAWDGKQYFYECVCLFASQEIILNNPLLGNKLHKVEMFQQYTGSKDKNRKEIYEGDILSLMEPKFEDTQQAFGTVQICFGKYDDSEMEWGSPAIGWYTKGFHGYNRLNGSSDRYPMNEQSIIQCLNWEIIGNIYENPELILLSE